MATYALGDINGDYTALMKLLDEIDFDKEHDSLWFTGNMVGEGNESLLVLNFIRELGSRAISVLGEQELMLLSIAEGYHPADSALTFDDILNAAERDAILSWLRQLPIFHYDRKRNYALVHAGIPVEWSLSQVSTFAIEAETALGAGNHSAYFENSRGNPPRRWNAKLRGWKRLHFIVSAFTRLRNCTEKGYMDFGTALAPAPPVEEYAPWYNIPGRATKNIRIIFSGKTAAPVTTANAYPLSQGNVFENLPGLIKLPSV